MRLKYLLYTGILLFLPLFASAQRIAGYLPSYTPATPPTVNVLTLQQIQYDKMTDVIFCFINPDASGTGALVTDRVGNSLYDFEMEKLQIVKSKCYPMVANGPRLWVALGGADPGNNRAARIAGICSGAAGRTTLATNLVNFAITHDLEGIDLDWEFPSPGGQATNLSQFIVELRNRINLSTNPKLKISVAVGGETIGGCSSGHLPYFDATVAGVIAAVDYFHIMTYDLPASYNANHSTLANSNTSLNDWSTCKGIPKSKMMMGVPFYGRSNPRGTITNYFALGAGADGTDGPTSSVYYNGDATIAAKIDAVRSTHGAAGVMIWDVSMDKAAGGASLLSDMYTKMFGSTNNTNPCSPIPFIGKDTTICSTPGITLNSGVAATGGTPTRTFQWYNGATALGTSPTQAITTAGTYSVVVSQVYNPAGGYSACILKDTIVVSLQTDAPTPTASPTTVCATGTASSTLNSSSSVQWYTSASSGAPIATGTSTSVSPSVTTTYYTQGTPAPTNKKYYGGRPYMDNTTALWNERTANATQTTRPEWVQVLTVLQPVTLTSVVAYFASNQTHNPVRIMVMDGSVDGSTTLATVPTQVSANQSAAVTVNAHPTLEPWTGYPTVINVGITFQPGTYYVGLYNSDGFAAPEYAVVQTALSYPTGFPGVFTIGGNARQNYGGGYGVPGTHYGQLFDWRFTSAALSQCSRKSVVVTYDCPAPVELINFDGKNIDQKNYLSWITGSETNNNYFNIERSVDGISYEVIGNVDGSGNSREMVNYSFIDQNPLNGINYYRLAQYDFDGTVSYTVIVVDNKLNALYEISPNPFDNGITVKSNSIDHARTLQVTNVQGALIYEEHIAAGTESVTLGSNFDAGVYFLKILDGESSYNYKIIKK